MPPLFCVPTSRSSVLCRFGLSTETRCCHRKLCFFLAAHRSVTRSAAITSRRTMSQRCLATKPRKNFPFLKRTPSTIRAASRCRLHLLVTDVGNCLFFGHDLLRIDDHAAMDPCLEQVIFAVNACSATVRSLTSSTWKILRGSPGSKVAFSSSAEATTAFPSATSALSSNTCVVRAQLMAAWKVA